jgi:hypothetical protein
MKADRLIKQHSIQDRLRAESPSSRFELFPRVGQDTKQGASHAAIDCDGMVDAVGFDVARVDAPPAPRGVGQKVDVAMAPCLVEPDTLEAVLGPVPPPGRGSFSAVHSLRVIRMSGAAVVNGDAARSSTSWARLVMP